MTSHAENNGHSGQSLNLTILLKRYFCIRKLLPAKMSNDNQNDKLWHSTCMCTFLQSPVWCTIRNAIHSSPTPYTTLLFFVVPLGISWNGAVACYFAAEKSVIVAELFRKVNCCARGLARNLVVNDCDVKSRNAVIPKYHFINCLNHSISNRYDLMWIIRILSGW